MRPLFSRAHLAGWLVVVGAASSALGQVVYVDVAAAPGGDGGSWGAAFSDLQQALAAARASVSVREIRVARGVYRPGAPGNRSGSFALADGVALRGGYAGTAGAAPDARDPWGTPSILSGDLAGNDVAGDARGDRSENAHHVVSAVGLEHATVIDGFHITGGNADGAGENEFRGGGLFVDQCGGNLTVSRCVVRDNQATIGAGVMILDSEALVSQCVVSGNRGFGWPGLRAEGMRLPMAPTLEHSTFVYNMSTSGASAGAACLAFGPNPDPESPDTTVPLRMTVRGCIGFGNNRLVFEHSPVHFAGYFTATDTIATGATSWNGVNGNSDADPLFADALGPDGVSGTLDDDLRLLPGSPAIDAGGDVPTDRADVDGDGVLDEPAGLDAEGIARVHSGAADMGAYEGPVLTVLVSPAPVVVQEGGVAAYVVRLSRDPGRVVTVSAAAQPVGGTAPVMTPSLLQFSGTAWEDGVSVSIGWPSDQGVTDDDAALVFSGPGLASISQAVHQVDGTTPPGVIYVNPQGTLPPDGASWASGHRTIEAALGVAMNFPSIREVWVKAGSYLPPLPAGSTDNSQRTYVVRPGLKVIGGFSGNETSPSQRNLATGVSVFNGDMLGNDGEQFSNYGDNVSTVFQVTNATDGTEIDGFQFTHLRGPAVSSTTQGFVSDRLNVRNCRFTFTQRTSVAKSSAGGRSGVYDCVFEDTNSVFAPSSWALAITGNSDGNPENLIEVKRCVFRRTGGGGGLYFGGPRVEVSDCDFSSIGGSSGTVWIDLYGTAEAGVFANVERCSLVDSNSGMTVRAEQAWMATVLTSRITGCTFRNVGRGLNPTPVTEVVGCLFENNIGGGGGTGKGYLNCVFRGNRAARGGAGPSGADGCVFENNTATQAGGACEGGSFVRCTFRNNSAPQSGAIAGGARLESCVFEGNRATAGSWGAVGGAALAASCVFTGNTATEDGGAGTVGWVVACTFSGNTAGGRGGALYAPTQVVNSVFTGNSAGSSGGAVYRVYRMLGCTVYGNHAAAAGGLDSPGAGFEPMCVANSILWANTADMGTLETQQVRTPLTFPPVQQEVLSGRSASPGSAWGTGMMVLGPVSGGFSPEEIRAAMALPFGPPYTNPFAANTPAGSLAAMTPTLSQPESWISVLHPSNASMPSALIRLGTGTAPRAFASVEWRFSFASDGTVGDDRSPGLYLGSTPIPGTTGGARDVQTDWVLDVSDAMEPAVYKQQGIYLRNDEGFAGLRMRSLITFNLPTVSNCIVQGLSAFAGNGNTGGDPQLEAIAGPDGVLGTGDDDATPMLTSPAVDSGNSRLIGIDEGDVDGDADTVEPILTDLVGSPRIADCPVINTSVGVRGPVDRGAIEVLPFAMLMAPPCAADIGSAGGVRGRDGALDNNDFVVFIDAFFAYSPVADVGGVGGVVGADGRFDNNDFVVYVDRFFAGC